MRVIPRDGCSSGVKVDVKDLWMYSNDSSVNLMIDNKEDAWEFDSIVTNGTRCLKRNKEISNESRNESFYFEKLCIYFISSDFW